MNDHIQEQLRSVDIREFHRAIENLKLVPEADAHALLVEMTREAKGEHRARAIDALVELFPDRAGSVAVTFLADPEWYVRTTSIHSLWKLHDGAALSQICQMLIHDEDEFVRSWAAFYLGAVGDPSVIPFLVSCVENDHGTNHEGTPNSEIANKAIENIRSRLQC